MTFDGFDIDFQFTPHVVLSQVCSGQAQLVRLLKIKNLRGDENSRINLIMSVNGRTVCSKGVKGLTAQDDALADEKARAVMSAMVAPRDLPPGQHKGVLTIKNGSGMQEIPFHFEVLGANVVPIDFPRAHLLAAHISDSAAMREAALQAFRDTPPCNARDALKVLYNMLVSLDLTYMEPVTTQYAHCQLVSRPEFTMKHGGSCMDLSLLLASLLHNCGRHPALLLFDGHVTAGCFCEDPLPSFVCLSGSSHVLELLDQGKLYLVEATRACHHHKSPFESAENAIRHQLESGRPACYLINVSAALRSKQVHMLPDTPYVTVRCRGCGREGLDPAMKTCPACGTELSAAPTPIHIEDPIPVPIPLPTQSLIYAAKSDGYVINGTNKHETEVRIPATHAGKPVIALADKAFDGKDIELLMLPSSLRTLGDYCCRGCKKLESVALPEGLRTIGRGAFSGSALRQITIPAGVERIPQEAFLFCRQLTSVTLPEGLQSIEQEAFASCVQLRAVHIPASVKYVYASAFPEGCELVLLSEKTQVK